MSLFNDEAKMEIERLREIIRKLETSKGVKMVTVEIAPKPGYGYLFYITAPTAADEKEFGMALNDTITSSFRSIGVSMTHDFSREVGDPPSAREAEIERSLDAREPETRQIEIGKDCFIQQTALGRWMIVSAKYRALAWSGSRWVPHNRGTGSLVQVSNFEDKMEAFKYADEAGLHVLISGYTATESNITCFKCGMTSYNKNDVEKKYCGNCHEFHERVTQ